MGYKIGLEVHLQLNTKTKLFCSCPNASGDPNTNVCEICMGMPGSKPRLNAAAVKFAMQLALALNCKIPAKSVFARKTYFYPDLPKDYQITQLEHPVAVDGSLNVQGRDIPITRIQIEEDPASLKHDAHDHSLIDYNRAGTPLCEIVTPPEFKSPAEARAFLDAIMRLADYIGIFDYQNGKMRADVNVSVDGHPRVEVKNVTSFRDAEKAAQYEIIRQESVVQQGGKGVAETRGYNPSGVTDTMRRKETEEEYGYIPEPDLVPIIVVDSELQQLQKSMPETPSKRQERLVKDYGIDTKQAEALISERAIVDHYEHVAKKSNPSLAAIWYGYVQKILNYNGMRFAASGITEEQMVEFLKLVESGEVSKRGAELLLRELVVKPGSPKEIAKKLDLLTLDLNETESIVKKVLAENQKAIDEYKQGKKKALQFLVGQVIRASKGRADEKKVLELLMKSAQ